MAVVEARYRYRLRTNADQERLLQGVFDACRAVWNTALGRWSDLWRHEGESLHYHEADLELTDWRGRFEWLGAQPSVPQQQVLRDLYRSISAFFDKANPAGRPRFKSRKAGYATARWTRNGFKVSGSGRGADGDRQNPTTSVVGAVKARISKPLLPTTSPSSSRDAWGGQRGGGTSQGGAGEGRFGGAGAADRPPGPLTRCDPQAPAFRPGVEGRWRRSRHQGSLIHPRRRMCGMPARAYRSNHNVVFSSKYHLVWCPKYRRRVTAAWRKATARSWTDAGIDPGPRGVRGSWEPPGGNVGRSVEVGMVGVATCDAGEDRLALAVLGAGVPARSTALGCS
jgi:hypothetical protein